MLYAGSLLFCRLGMHHPGHFIPGLTCACDEHILYCMAKPGPRPGPVRRQQQATLLDIVTLPNQKWPALHKPVWVLTSCCWCHRAGGSRSVCDSQLTD
jgi:hypothetical protein